MKATENGKEKRLVENNGSLDGSFVPHGFEALAPLLELVSFVHDASNLDLASVKIADGRREHVSFREGTENGNLIPEDLARGPGDTSRVAVDSVNHQLTATTNVVDRVLEDLGGSGGLNNDVETVGVGILEGLELSFGVGTRELNVLVASFELLGQVHLETSRGGDDDMGPTVVLEELGKAETGRASTEHEDGRTKLGGNLLQPVARARGRLQEGGIDIAQVVDLEDLASGVRAVFSETAIHSDTVGLKAFAEQSLAASTVEAFSTELGVVGADTLANGEVLDSRSDSSNDTDSLVAGDERELGNELSIVDVQIRSAHSTSFHLD